MWFDLKGDERITQRCATEGCGGAPTSRLEADGVGLNYCSGCRADIETLPDRLAAARELLSSI